MPSFGGNSKRGAPVGNQNARRHGFYARKTARPVAVAAEGGGAHAALSPPDGAGVQVSGAQVSGAQVSPAPSPIPTLDDLILELYSKQQDLGAYLRRLNGNDDPDVEARKLAAFDLFRQNTATLGRLIAYRGQGDTNRELTGALNQVLDMMGRELGIPL